MSIDQQYFQTSDTNIASWLLTKRVPYRSCFLSDDGTFVTFRFVNSDRIRDLIDDYTFDAECSAKALLDSYRFLMNQVKQARRQARNGGAQ
jgi:hypothetical protein